MYLHEWLMCMVNGDVSFQTTNSSTINVQRICSNFQGGNDNSEIQVYSVVATHRFEENS